MTKQELRTSLRGLRRALPDRADRSASIWASLVELDEYRRAERIMVFDTIAGEPDTAPFVVRCHTDAKLTAVPEDHPDPSWPDLVLVPGLAFTDRGERLGQGGGWYDRFLGLAGDACVRVGVCFAEQLVEMLPVEPHDIVMTRVITDAGLAR